MMRPLAEGFQVDVDAVDDRAWHDIAARFADVNIYQVWQRQSAQTPLARTSRMLLTRRDDVVAAAEARLYVLPPTSRGIAYVRWGPLWRTEGAADLNCFRQIVRALRNEYVYRRRMILRVNPRLFLDEDRHCLEILRDEGFAAVPDAETERTLLVDLTPGLDDLRCGLDKKWRNCLSKAERAGLTVEAGFSDDLFNEFTSLYEEMLRRKRFVPTADIEHHRRLHGMLPAELKMDVVLAREDGRPCAGAIVATAGDTAVYLFGATNEAGMRSSGAYLVQWEVLKRLKDRGIRLYDLHGINPELNPGTYHFKKGLAPRTAKEVTFSGQVQSFEPSIRNRSLLLLERWYRARRARRTSSVNPPSAVAAVSTT